MNRNHKKWSASEESILLANVKAHANCLKTAFIETHEATGRSVGACSSYWYTVLSKKEGKENTALVCVSKKYVGRNRKNCTTPLTTQEKRGFWKSILTKLFR